MSGSGNAAGFGLLSATSWGGSDFVGGIGARRSPALLVVASGQIFSLILLLGICWAMHVELPNSDSLLYSAVGGFEGAVALAIFYRALAMGAMGLTAALTGLLTALVPVLFSLFQEGLPSPVGCVGLALGLGAIWLITLTPAAKVAGLDGTSAKLSTNRPRASRLPLFLGALSGVGFGAQLILIKMAGSGGVLWIMTSTRAAGVLALVIVLAVMPPKTPWRGFWLTGIVAGSLDTLGNLFYIQATRVGRLDVAAIVGSMYPAGTILLAAVVLREWPTVRQFMGIALALAAVGLLSM